MFGRRRIAGLVLAGLALGGIGGCHWFGKKPEMPQPPPEADRSPGPGVRRQTIRTPLACVRDGSVWLMDGSGNDQRRVSAPGRAIPESLQWSADAARLAFWTIEEGRSGRSGPFRLCVAPTRSEGAAEVVHTTEAGLGGDRPFFSRTGNVVCASVFGGTDGQGVEVGGLFATRFTGNAGVLKFRLAGGETERLVPDRPLGRGPLRWAELAPDGSTLVGVSGRDVADGHLVLVDFASGEVTEVRNRKALYAAWSPARRRLAYLRLTEDGSRELRVWTPGEETSRKVVGGLAEQATFAWAPQGGMIAYSNVDTYAIVAETPTGEWQETRSQEQEGSLHRWPTWSPNGIAVVLERRPAGQHETILHRDPLTPSVTEASFFAGGTRPLFAPA